MFLDVPPGSILVEDLKCPNQESGRPQICYKKIESSNSSNIILSDYELNEISDLYLTLDNPKLKNCEFYFKNPRGIEQMVVSGGCLLGITQLSRRLKE